VRQHAGSDEPPMYSRRLVLGRAAAAGIGLPFLPALLAACDAGTSSEVDSTNPSTWGTGGVSGAPYPLARPEAPVSWTVDPVQRIPADQPPEPRAILTVLRRPGTLSPDVLAPFARTHRCRIREISFNDSEEVLAILARGSQPVDLVVGFDVVALARAIVGGLLRPIDLDRIPNLASTTWEALRSPFYDVGSHYSVPFSVWMTGIAWRNDHVHEAIGSMANPWDFFWNGAPVDHTHVLDDPRETIALGLYRDGADDVNSADADVVTSASVAVATQSHATNGEFDHEEGTDLLTGKAWLHHARSSAIAAAVVTTGSAPAARLSFDWPAESNVPASVANDLLAIPTSGTNPVLAHLLSDHLLAAETGMKVANSTGLQMPATGLTPAAFVDEGVVPEHLSNLILAEADLDRGSRLMELTPSDTDLWLAEYRQLSAEI
jgi:spermidine/putrescine transport system substrate-binding protein